MEHESFYAPFFGFFALNLVFLLLVTLLVTALLVLGAIVVVQAYKESRIGWWVYLIAMFVGPFNLVAVIAWFAYLRKNPVLDGQGRPFL